MNDVENTVLRNDAMKLVQVAHAITKGDAASNQILAMDAAFRELGYETEIYSGKIDKEFIGRVNKFSKFVPDKKAILIYHMTTGTSFTNAILSYPYPIVLYYHNITPARYFVGNAWGSCIKSIKGRYQLRQLKAKTFFAWTASEYSREELIALGFKDTAVLPILVNFEEYRNIPIEQSLYSSYQDGKLNILVVGRVTPHKKQDEAIRLVSYYKKNISSQVRLIIVGNPKDSYGKKMNKLIRELDLEKDVILTGKVSFADLCTYYHLSDILLSLSEHEGFCVPIVEGMIFDKTIVAYAATAVPETVGAAGILLENKENENMATIIQRTMSSSEIQSHLAEERKKRLISLSHQNLLNKISEDVQRMTRMMKC